MAYENNLETISLPAAGDLSTKQFCGVIVNSSGQVALAGAGAAAVGILQDNPSAAGRAACVATGGVSKVAAGGAVTAGARFAFDANGKAVAVSAGTDWSIGVALETFANGGIYSALIQPTGPTA